MNKNYGYGRLNDSDFSRVSGGLSTAAKVAIVASLAAIAMGGAYSAGAIYDKKRKDSVSKGWGDSFKHPFGLFRDKKEGAPE